MIARRPAAAPAHSKGGSRRAAPSAAVIDRALEGHAHLQAGALRSVEQLDMRAVPLRDRLHDGQSESAAGLRAAAALCAAVEAVEHALALGGRDARAVV